MLRVLGLLCSILHNILVYFVGLFDFVARSSDVVLQQMEAKRAGLLSWFIAVDQAPIGQLDNDVLFRHWAFLF